MNNDSNYSPSDIEDNKAIAALSYLGLLVLIPLLAKKDSPFAQFHAKQGLVLLIAWVIIGFVSWIPFVGWVVGILGAIFLFVLFIMGLVNSLSGQVDELPLIGQYAKNFNI